MRTTMDAGRLLKTVSDVLHDEDNFELQNHFQKILDAFSQGQRDIIDSERSALKDALPGSNLANYVRTDYEILEALGAIEYFGDRSLARLNEILRGETHAIKDDLAKFILERKRLLDKFGKLETAMDEFGIEQRELPEGQYQFAFVLPESYRDLASVEGVVRDVHLLLDAVAAAKNELSVFRVGYVSSSELQFYIDLGSAMAQNMGAVMDSALKLFERYQAYDTLKAKTSVLSKQRKENAIRLAEEEKEERKKDFADTLINELGIENPEDQNRVRTLFAKFLLHLEKGVTTEIRTPLMDEPEDSPEDATSEEKQKITALKKQYKQKASIDAKSKEMYILQVNNFGGVKLDFLEEVIREHAQELKRKAKKKTAKKKRS
jgi:hypothetical protein